MHLINLINRRLCQLALRSLVKSHAMISSQTTAPVLELETGLAAGWLLKRSAGVAPEIDLRECTLHLSLQCK